MEKEVGSVKVTETDDGYRIDIKGKDLRALCGCGCVPQGFTIQTSASSCCEPEKDKK